ncbi:MAG TPA: helix-turn-helix domain-containing protein [Longimicrobiaceae bacterium]|nr:helix-turn-helix domain-containing protein [Longimicrobiaceae bacterium]
MPRSDWGPARYVLGGYREYAPPQDLVHVVDSFWTYSAPSVAPAGMGHDVLPDPGLSLCFWHWGTSDMSLVVVGPVYEVRRLAPEPGTLLEAVRLWPERSRDLLGIDPREQADGLNPLDQVRTRDAARLRDRYTRSGGRGAGIDILLDELRDRCGRSPSRAATLAARGLDHIRGVRETNVRLHPIARELGVSERHLRRVIRETTGSGPKYHHRVARLNRAVAAADDDPDPNWSRLAARHGFYDQSHMIQEFRALAGSRPVELHHERRQESLGGLPR